MNFRLLVVSCFCFLSFILFCCNKANEKPTRIYTKINSGIIIDDTTKVSFVKYCINIQIINPTSRNYFLSRPGLFSYFSNRNINPYYDDWPYLFNLRELWNNYHLKKYSDSLYNYSLERFPKKEFLHQYVSGIIFLRAFDTVSYTYTFQKHIWFELNRNVTFRVKHNFEPEKYSRKVDLLKRDYQDIPNSFLGFEQYLGVVHIDSLIIPWQVLNKQPTQ